MNGIDTLTEIIKFNEENEKIPDIGVIMVSTLTLKGADITLNCLNLGAFDFISKPNHDNPEDNINDLQQQLLSKIHSYYNRKNRSILNETISSKQQKIFKRASMDSKNLKLDAIIISASTGGPKAISELLPNLTNYIDIPIIILQQMPPFYVSSFANNLNMQCKKYSVSIPNDGDIVKNNNTYIAPGGKHLTIKKNSYGVVIIELSDNKPENDCKPSADVLFRSVGLAYGGNCLVLLLTGEGKDGVFGLKPLKRKGAHVIAQNEETSIIWEMPGNACDAGFVDEILPLNEIVNAIKKRIK